MARNEVWWDPFVNEGSNVPPRFPLVVESYLRSGEQLIFVDNGRETSRLGDQCRVVVLALLNTNQMSQDVPKYEKSAKNSMYQDLL